jgi:hypothetical protein
MEFTMKTFAATCLALSLFALLTGAVAQEWLPGKDQLSRLCAGNAYSPYAARTFPERPLWGDTHLHTSCSFDAGGFGNRLDPRVAYRFARGEEAVSSTGQRVRLSRPLDWLAIADDTVVNVSTDDNGAEKFKQPDGGTEPDQGEKSATWVERHYHPNAALHNIQ